MTQNIDIHHVTNNHDIAIYFDGASVKIDRNNWTKDNKEVRIEMDYKACHDFAKRLLKEIAIVSFPAKDVEKETNETIVALDELICIFEEKAAVNDQLDIFLGGRIVHRIELAAAVRYLKELKDRREQQERELDDNPNWRAAHPEKYGVRR